MSVLIIRNFSCVESADIELGGLVVLIGPQASGKSVISKLTNFLTALPGRMLESCRFGRTYRQFRDVIEDEFIEQFPPATWMDGVFEITLKGRDFEFKIIRKEIVGRDGRKVIFDASDPFQGIYRRVLRGYRKAAGSGASLEEEDEFFFRSSETVYNADRRIRRQVAKELSEFYNASQLFVPAGRAFFTSLGSVFAAFERGGMLDPVTREFGTMFALLRDAGQRRPRSFRVRSLNKDLPERVQPELLGRQFFGGEIKLGKQREYVEANDGRKIPFSVLSSGQQELLPLWLSLELFSDRSRVSSDGLNQIFIEEPEAHLFPSTQNTLIEYLATLIGPYRRNRMFLTTHSPYVLAKVNNLLFAYTVANAQGSVAKVERVVPKAAWLDPTRVRAYALQEGVAKNILKDGLVDAAYLDNVSSELSKEFDKLMKLMPYD